MPQSSRTPASPARQPTSLVLAFFLLSGFSALVYEIVWLKLLTLALGNTIFSVTAVLTAFMGGLALGSILAGRFIDRAADPLLVYGRLELLIGACGLLVPLLIAGSEPLFRLLYQSVHPSFAALDALRFLVCTAILAVPTTLMGATLPVLSRYLVTEEGQLAWTVGRLYGINTLGAVLGSALAGFALIPSLGLRGTTLVAVALNLGVGAAVLLIRRRGVHDAPEAPAPSMPPPATGGLWSERTAVAALAAIALSGLAAMIYQVAWTRVLALFIGSSVYAFSLIVTAFVAGIALGSLLVARLADRRRDLVAGLAGVQAAIGIAALALIPLLGRLPPFVAALVLAHQRAWGRLAALEFGVILLLLLVPTLLMGAAFPLAAKLCTRDVRRVGALVGDVYGANTGGAIVGVLAAGLLLIPRLGTERTILVGVGVNLGAAALLFAAAPTWPARRRALAGGLALATAAAAWPLAPRWDAVLLTSGPYMYADRYREFAAQKSLTLADAMREGPQVLFFQEGLHAAVSVRRAIEGELMLGINGKTDATAHGDAATQLMVGHLPLLLDPDARDVLVIGLGSGMTLGAALQHPVRAVEVVEVEPAVVAASAYFDGFTHRPLADPRVHLMLADGRNYLALSDRTYDVLISEPSNPWVSGMANLFTREYFASAKRHLRAGGVMCQWVQTYSMAPADVKTIVATFAAVFPDATVWEADLGNDYLLIGSAGARPVDQGRVVAALGEPRLAADFATMDLEQPAAFLGKLVLAGDAVAAFAAGAPLNTDDNARVEYSAPRALFASGSSALVAELYAHRTPPAEKLAALGWPAAAPALRARLDSAFQTEGEIVAGYVAYANSQWVEAVAHLDRARALAPDSYRAAYLLAGLYNDLGHRVAPAQARESYARSLGVVADYVRRHPRALDEHFLLAVVQAQAALQAGLLALNANAPDEAVRVLGGSLDGPVRYPEAINNLGVAYERLGQYADARTQYERALAEQPGYIPARMNLGNTYLREGRYADASARYREVIAARPHYAAAYYNLGVTYYKRGEWSRAAQEWRRALKYRPDFAEALQSLDLVRDSLRAQ